MLVPATRSGEGQVQVHWPGTESASMVTVGFCQGAIAEGVWTFQLRQSVASSEPWQPAPAG